MWNWWRKPKQAEADSFSLTKAVDFSSVDSRERAEQLYQEGKLSRVYLMPREAGGHDGGLNVAYVTALAKQEKEHIDARILQAASEGAEIHYSTRQIYKGESFVPAQIIITVSGTRNAEYVVQVW